MVAEDMKLAGQTTSSWIAQDMERAGHPDAHLNKGTTAFVSQQKRETEEFMSGRKVKTAPAKQVKLEDTPPKQVELKDAPPKQVELKDEPVMIVANEDTAVKVDLPADALNLDFHADALKVDLHEKATNEHHGVKDFVKRAAKKAVMPWKKWKDL